MNDSIISNFRLAKELPNRFVVFLYLISSTHQFFCTIG